MRRGQHEDGPVSAADRTLASDRDDGPDAANLTAELRYEAPLATFDGDEWTEFLLDVPPPPLPPDTNYFRSPSPAPDVTSGDTFSETFSGSLEDLVNTFDAKITKCFRNYNEHADEIAPVQIRTQDELLADSQSWWTITGSVAGDWCKTYTLPTDALYTDITRTTTNLKRSISTSSSCTSDDDNDDEPEVVSAQNHDDVSSGLDEPLVTADDVISEIESMMEDNDSCVTDHARRNITSSVTSRPDLLRLSAVHKSTSQTSALTKGTTGLDCLSVGGLAELADELQRCVHEYSEELVTELARRDELDFEKELKNQFIWLLLRIQRKRRELSQLESRAAVTGINKASASNNEYLKTVIPYEPSRGPPTVDRLQIYIRILAAINDDSGTVPTLLTDYILNVLCPTTT